MTDDSGRLLQFLAPGLLHSMGNALFAVQGHAQMLGAGESEGERENERENPEPSLAESRENILEACRDAQEATELLRYLIGVPDPKPVSQPVAALLQRLGDLLRVCLRERGLAFSMSMAGAEEEPRVAARTLVASVLETLYALIEHLPTGLGCELRVELLPPSSRLVVLRVSLVQDPSDLPFGLDLAAVIEDAKERLGAFDGEIGVVSGRQSLELRLPNMAEFAPQLGDGE